MHEGWTPKPAHILKEQKNQRVNMVGTDSAYNSAETVPQGHKKEPKERKKNRMANCEGTTRNLKPRNFPNRQKGCLTAAKESKESGGSAKLSQP